MLYSKYDLLIGGPGLDGYTFEGAVYCADCAQVMVRGFAQESFTWDEMRNSEVCPQPIFFGESELPMHCAECGDWLYGPADACRA